MALNLAQRRHVTEFQAKTYEDWKKKLMAIIGFEVPIEVKWDEFYHDSENTAAATMEEGWNNIFFTPLTRAFSALCQDDMGKSAVREKLKQIIIAPDASMSSIRNSFTFEGGVVKITHNSRSNGFKVDERSTEWQKKMEEAL